MTYYLGPWQYLLRRRRVRADVRGVVGPSDAVIFRVGSQVAACLEPHLRRTGHGPTALEVVSDPYDNFAPGAVRASAAPVLPLVVPTPTPSACAPGPAGHSTSRIRPCSVGILAPAYSTGVSDVELPESAIAVQGSLDRAASPGR